MSVKEGNWPKIKQIA